MSFDILYVLEVVLQKRQKLKPVDSYSAYLFSCGLPRILDKLGEEVIELIVAARHRQQKDIIHEAADAMFHLLVFMVCVRIRLEDVLPAEKSLNDDQLDELISDHKKDDSFFFMAPVDSLGKIVFLSNQDISDHKRYENMCAGCRQLLSCILMLCAVYGIRIATVTGELELRVKNIHAQHDRKWMKH